MEKPFEFFDVTADIGFYSYGHNLEEVFENAGLAMFNVISNTDDIRPVETKEISVTSEDKISLLYDFLEELLFMHEVEFMLFSQFEVAIKKDGENYKLDAAIKGEEINWEIHERGEEVKDEEESKRVRRKEKKKGGKRRKEEEKNEEKEKK